MKMTPFTAYRLACILLGIGLLHCVGGGRLNEYTQEEGEDSDDVADRKNEFAMGMQNDIPNNKKSDRKLRASRWCKYPLSSSS